MVPMLYTVSTLRTLSNSDDQPRIFHPGHGLDATPKTFRAEVIKRETGMGLWRRVNLLVEPVATDRLVRRSPISRAAPR
jgi:hypothetical protein